MDLRHIEWTQRERMIFHKSIVQRRFIYQPYILSEDLEIGEGMDFYDGYRQGKRRCVYWHNAPDSVNDILAPNKAFFRKCNNEWRIHYESFLDAICAMCGDQISKMTFAEIGCNGGYFLYGLMLRGAAGCHGFDYTPFHDIFAILDKRLDVNVRFDFSQWDSLEHQLLPNAMPEVDVAITAAFLCHIADPIYHLAYICERAKRGIFIWTPVLNCSPESPPFEHWETDLLLSYCKPRRHTDELMWPISFDYNVRPSVPLLHACLREAGFEEIYELECPIQDPRWMSIYKSFRAFYAKRTKDGKSLLSQPSAKRSRPSNLQEIIDDAMEISRGV